jgi:hypothetical protein
MEEYRNMKHFCERCNYRTEFLKDFKKHMRTKKHLANTNSDTKLPFVCECGKQYKHHSSLHNHKKTCKISCNLSSDIVTYATTATHYERSIQDPSLDTSSIDTTLVMSILKENNDFKSMLLEQSNHMKQVQIENNELQKQLIDVIKLQKSITTTTTHNTNNTNNITNNNQSFNLNFFLNEQCKNAMNIDDFIQSLKLETTDIEETGRMGYVQGISRIFMNKLNELDMYTRPLHCTDLKRETLYIKEDDRWEKDNDNKDKLKCIVEKVAGKNYDLLPQWQENNPNHLVTNTPECDQFMEIACNVLGGGNEKETNKFQNQIMRNVLKEVTLDKF